MKKSSDWLAAPGDPIGVRHPAKPYGYLRATALQPVPRNATDVVQVQFADGRVQDTWTLHIVADVLCPACGLHYWTDSAAAQQDPYDACPRCDGQAPWHFRDMACTECGATTREAYVPAPHTTMCPDCERCSDVTAER